MSVVGELYRVRTSAWVCSVEPCLPEYVGGTKHQKMGKLQEWEHVIFLGKKLDAVSRELYLVVLTRFGVGCVHPSTL
jgi:hypothetical protein